MPKNQESDFFVFCCAVWTVRKSTRGHFTGREHWTSDAKKKNNWGKVETVHSHFAQQSLVKKILTSGVLWTHETVLKILLFFYVVVSSVLLAEVRNIITTINSMLRICRVGLKCHSIEIFLFIFFTLQSHKRWVRETTTGSGRSRSRRTSE